MVQNFLSRFPRWLIRGASALALLALFGIMQLLPIARDHTNPPVQQEPAWDSPQTRALARRACFDCHSNETRWPWYSQIAPFSWMVAQDVFTARATLNFSEWTPIPDLEPGEMKAIVEEGEMPPGIYLLAHPDARLSMDEVQQLADGLSKSLPAHETK